MNEARVIPTADGPLADILQQALLPVVGHDICSQADWWSVLATDKMVCAGGDGVTAGCNVSSYNCSLIANYKNLQCHVSCLYTC